MNTLLSRAGKLYGILDQDLCLEKNLNPLEFARGFFNAGGDTLQYRDKSSAPDQVKKQAELLFREACDSQKLLIINDHVDVAISLGCPFHIGQEDLPHLRSSLKKATQKPKPWGLSTHNIQEIKIALGQTESSMGRPDYIGLGRVFPSRTKASAPASSISASQALKVWSQDIVLIGGITLERLGSLPRNPRTFYAVIHDFFRYGDSPQAIERYTKEFLSRC